MRIQEKHMFHGSALTQIVEHPSFKALNRASSHYGHYLVNTDTQILVKYRTAECSPWQFVFSPDEIHELRQAHISKNDTFICLVCGSVTVCVLNEVESKTVLDMGEISSQSVTVEVQKGASCRVKGTGGKLRRAVPHNAFPARLFS